MDFTTFIVLAEPLSPTLYVTVGLVVLQEQSVPEPLGVPDQHVVVDLHPLCVEHDVTNPIRQPARSEHLVEESLMELALRLNVLEENNLEEVSLQEDVDYPWAHLHNGQVEEESRAEERQVHVVVHVGEGVVLFVGQRLDQIVVDLLFEGPDIFRLMLKKFREIGVIASLPFGFPAHLHSFVSSDEISVNILEVEDVCSIFGDVLKVAVDVMNGLPSIFVVFAELLSIDHLEIGFNCGIGVDPDIDKSIQFFCMVFSQFR